MLSNLPCPAIPPLCPAARLATEDALFLPYITAQSPHLAASLAQLYRPAAEAQPLATRLLPPAKQQQFRNKRGRALVPGAKRQRCRQ